MNGITYREAMRKTAGNEGGGPTVPFGGLVAEGMNTGTAMGAELASYVLAAALTTALGAGYIGAKMTSDGKEDMDTVHKEYENERLKADLGYLSGKVRQELNASKARRAPKEAYIMGR